MLPVRLRREVRDLGATNPGLGGILSPGYTDAELDRHIHALFQERYQEYLRPFPLDRGAIDHWKDLIRAAVPAAAIQGRSRLTILDVGSGGGTSVFPLIELFPDADIVASDLSLGLLMELRQWHAEHYPEHRRLSLLQLDAEDTVFEDEHIDLVIGAHILHHLGRLDAAFAELHRILRPGGAAVFWEPFESGSQVVSFVLQLLIARSDAMPEAERIAPEIITGFRVFLFDLHRRKGTTKSPELLEEIDDKWIFTETQLRRLVGGSGLELTAIHQVYSPENLIVTMVDHELRRCMHTLESLPDWARDLVHEINGQLSPELCSELLFSGAIVLSKGAAGASSIERISARPVGS